MAENLVINIKGVDVYQREYQVLEDVNFQLHEGQFSYLIGRTGSGKSSLLKVIYGDLPIQNGTAEVVGYNLLDLKTSKIPFLRRHLGVVFQDFQLLTDRNVEKNLLFVLKATGWKDKNLIKERIEEVLDSVNMLKYIHKMPFQLSGGEQQRIAIARALLNHPELILADEPTGNLDPETSAEIMQLLRQISEKRNCAVLMATHDYDIIRGFPATTFVCQGKGVHVAEEGSLSLT